MKNRCKRNPCCNDPWDCQPPAQFDEVKPLKLFDPADDEAMEWITRNLTAIRRDNGALHYDLTQVVRAYQAGRAAINTSGA